MVIFWLVIIFFQTYAVRCQEYEFKFRPINEYQNEGFVELRINATLGLMTAYRFSGSGFNDSNDITAKMLCQSFGFGWIGFSRLSLIEFNLTNSALEWDNVIQCSGNETDISECVTGTWNIGSTRISTLRSYGWTRLHCFDEKVTGIRLANGPYPHEGRFEVMMGNARWGIVCEPWNPRPMSYYGEWRCPLLGYSDKISKWKTSRWNVAYKPITEVWMYSLRCESSGITDINNCSWQYYNSGCVYVTEFRCEPVELINGTSPNAGIIVAGLFGQQYVICGSADFNAGAANVTCNLLGHRTVGRVSAIPRTPDSTVAVFNGFILCEGSEQSLEMCYTVQHNEECQDSTVVHLECLDDHIDFIQIENKTNEGIFTFSYFNKTWLSKGQLLSNTTAQTLCSLLGRGFNGTARHVRELPANVELPEHSELVSLECSGNETNIAQCLKTPYYSFPCWQCITERRPQGFAILVCDECSSGRYGKFCDECNCNSNGTHSCDIETGECLCKAGWSGISCEIDLDECNVPMLCPNNSVCINTAGSYQCNCKIGFTKTDGDCNNVLQEDCPLYTYLTLCTECNCNNRSTGPCHIETGECQCKIGWSGTSCEYDHDECIVPNDCPDNSVCTNTPGSYQCICNSGFTMANGVCNLINQKENTEWDSNFLIIILSSSVGGLLLISVNIICCICMYRRKAVPVESDRKMATKETGQVNAYPLNAIMKSEDISTRDATTRSAGKVQTVTGSRTDPYATIDDTPKSSSCNLRNNDTRPELLRRLSENKMNVRNMAIEDYDYPYPADMIKDDTGYIKLTGRPNNKPTSGRLRIGDTGSNRLSTDDDGYLRAVNTDKKPTEYENRHYQNVHSKQEHEYDKMKR